MYMYVRALFIMHACVYMYVCVLFIFFMTN